MSLRHCTTLALASLVACAHAPAAPSPLLAPDTAYDAKTEVRPSQVPGAGNGLYAAVRLHAGETVGVYAGRLVGDRDYPANDAHIVFLSDCALAKLAPYRYIDGAAPEVKVSRINFAPSSVNGVPTHLQNTYPQEFCEWPWITFVALRDIEPGEELFASYGASLSYYPFMADAAVQRFFCERAKVDCSARFDFGF